MARLNLSILAACLSLSALTSALPTKRFDPMADGNLNPASIAEMSLRSTVDFFDDMEKMWKEDQAEKNKQTGAATAESAGAVTSAVPMVPMPPTPSEEAAPSQQSHAPVEINKTSKGETSETYNDGQEAQSAPAPAPSRAMSEPQAEEKPTATTPQASSSASAAASPSGSVHEVKDNIFSKIPVVGKILSGGGIA
ncbi:hypothetical protein N8T08_000655 [Aspergillus melleus]|uniref:Uncharacterized protein n=1 Tax=Aspergillus melleus TaxID=138277 RepID=A0ACC3AQX5_9EURO|nr:hypothetical protein N8T08_000655 [Aspergillus melleus]